MVKRTLLLAGLLLAVFAGVASATTYLFEVPRMVVDLWPQTDGNLRVRYRITFKNLSADPLDIVDIGTPDDGYDLSTFRASLDGAALTTIRKSQYVTGVEVPLTGREIPKGRTRTLTVEFVHPRMVYYDDDDKGYTSVEFGNTFFGSQYVRGNTDLQIRWHFPKGITSNETKWHRNAPTAMQTESGHLVYIYRPAGATATAMVKTGIGFPSRVMQAGAIYEPSAFQGCLEAFFGLFTACLGMAGAILPMLFIPGAIILSIVFRRKRMKQYFPPRLSVEGAGPKRGLTAPEAALVLELPPNRVLMMIVFGLLKKGVVEIVKTKPLTLSRREVTGADLRPYEHKFLEAIKKTDGQFSETKLRAAFVEFIKLVQAKLKGFSLKDTRAHYRQIVAEAWRLVEENQTPEVGALFADRADWLAMDDDFDKRIGRTFTSRPVVTFPGWWGHAWHPTSVPSASGSFSPSGADWAASFTSTLTNAANSVVDSVSSFTASITQKTNPPPASSGRSSGGGCACACAGCACACAGGGR